MHILEVILYNKFKSSSADKIDVHTHKTQSKYDFW